MRHFVLLTLVIVQLNCLMSDAQLFGQAPDFAVISDRTSFGPVVMDEKNAYCYWPRSVVVESAVSAVELATGRLLWTKPASLAIPLAFRIDEGWLQYETAEGDLLASRRSTGPKTFHLVNAATGAELKFPHSRQLRAYVDNSWVHGDRCLTTQGVFMKCSDGTVIGDLGAGEHQTIVCGDKFLATTLVPDESNARFEKRLLRQFDLDTMQVEREMELPLETSWRIVAAKGDIVIGRTQVSDHEAYLVCIDLVEKKERWCVQVPKAVRPAFGEWQSESQLTLSMSVHGLMRPLQVDINTGAFAPDSSWSDPRLMLAWHQDAGQYPDFVAFNDKFIVGRWRFVQLCCVDPQSGKLLWNHGTSNQLISRVFGPESQLGDYIVAESRQGFDIVTVATGSRFTVTIEHVGLKAKPPQPSLDDEVLGATSVLFTDSNHDWFWDQGLLLGPLVPFVGWIVWSLIRR